MFFTILSRSLYYDLTFVEEAHLHGKPFFDFRFDNFINTLYTWWIATTGDNMADVTYNFQAMDPWNTGGGVYLGLAWFVCLFQGQVMVAVLTGVYANLFFGYYVEELNNLLETDPNYKILILRCLEDTILDPSMVREIINTYNEGGMEAVDNSESLNKRRALSESKKDEFGVEYDERYDNPFNNAYTSIFYRLITTSLDAFTAFIPMMKLDSFCDKTHNSDWYFVSEVCALFGICEVFMVSRFCTPNLIYRKTIYIKCVSSVLIIMMSWYLQLIPTSILDSEQYSGDRVIYIKIWAFCCLIKIFSIHTLLSYSKRYKIITDSLAQVGPVLADLFIMFIVVLLIYGNIGMYFFGGNITRKSATLFEKYTGNTLDGNANWYRMNFNDLPNSLFF